MRIEKCGAGWQVWRSKPGLPMEKRVAFLSWVDARLKLFMAENAALTGEEAAEIAEFIRCRENEKQNADIRAAAEGIRKDYERAQRIERNWAAEFWAKVNQPFCTQAALQRAFKSDGIMDATTVRFDADWNTASATLHVSMDAVRAQEIPATVQEPPGGRANTAGPRLYMCGSVSLDGTLEDVDGRGLITKAPVLLVLDTYGREVCRVSITRNAAVSLGYRLIGLDPVKRERGMHLCPARPLAEGSEDRFICPECREVVPITKMTRKQLLWALHDMGRWLKAARDLPFYDRMKP